VDFRARLDWIYAEMCSLWSASDVLGRNLTNRGRSVCENGEYQLSTLNLMKNGMKAQLYDSLATLFQKNDSVFSSWWNFWA